MQPVSGSQIGQSLPALGPLPCLVEPQLSSPLLHPAGPWPRAEEAGPTRFWGLEAGLSVCKCVHACVRVRQGVRV